MHKPTIISLAFGSMLLFLAACSLQEEQPAEEQMVEEMEPVVQEVVEDYVPEGPTVEEALRQIRMFYFNYDQSELRDGALEALDAHAAFILDGMLDNPDMLIVIEGHTDERGTIDYNNALGNRRAEAVARYLRVKGVPAAGIEVISFGELRPVSDESTEQGWQLNRRAVINY